MVSQLRKLRFPLMIRTTYGRRDKEGGSTQVSWETHDPWGPFIKCYSATNLLNIWTDSFLSIIHSHHIGHSQHIKTYKNLQKKTWRVSILVMKCPEDTSEMSCSYSVVFLCLRTWPTWASIVLPFGETPGRLCGLGKRTSTSTDAGAQQTLHLPDNSSEWTLCLYEWNITVTFIESAFFFFLNNLKSVKLILQQAIISPLQGWC